MASPALSGVLDNDAEYVAPQDMLAEMRENNKDPAPTCYGSCVKR